MKLWRLILFFSLIASSLGYGQQDNPFSVYHNAPKAVTPVVEDAEPVEDSNTKLTIDNPFTVSHIPIRKNQYKKIESLRTIPRQKKESISLSYKPLWIMIFSLCLLAYLIFIKKDHFNNLIRSILNDNYLRMMSYETSSGMSLPFMLGYALFLINILLFVVIVGSKLNYLNSTHSLWLLIGGMFLFFVGKHFVIAFFSWVFEFAKEAEVYQFAIISFRNILAILFLFINVLLIFGATSWVKPLAVIGAALFIIFLFSRYYKGIRISRSYINNYFFHFFLYFCAFEIAPWLVLYKMTNSLA